MIAQLLKQPQKKQRRFSKGPFLGLLKNVQNHKIWANNGRDIQGILKASKNEDFNFVRFLWHKFLFFLAKISDIVRWCRRASPDNFVGCQSSWLLSDLHKFGPIPKLGLICSILTWFQPQLATFGAICMNSLQRIVIVFSLNKKFKW